MAYNPLFNSARYGGSSRTEHTGGHLGQSPPHFPSPLGSFASSSSSSSTNRGYHRYPHGHPRHHHHRQGYSYEENGGVAGGGTGLTNVTGKCADVPQMANGRMLCVDDSNPYYGGGVGGPGIRCTPVCDPGHAFYQKFTSRPPTYVCNSRRVDWEIRRFIPDCSPIYPAAGVSCQPGWESRSANPSQQECVACPPGMHRSPGAGRLCQLCPKGTYSGGFGSADCSRCPRHHTTRGLGSRSASQCHYLRPEGIYRGGRRSSHGFLFYNKVSYSAKTILQNFKG
jgi:hypothetical protein